ncbi:protein CutA 1, chloroplastic-like isoform X2 [Zingiber officinale]|uniref:protein CutA 1, chloroplastic-like isoform X2 n=1 Tax=Zingiber officinale TaxID=94328 RepID=UPI001C4A7843|nr:protein CutA 1, chloroplastic-like isoform X2 [Zingiber officinale]
MPLLSLSRTFSAISPAPPRQPSSGAPKLRRRTPLFGALCLLSLGTLTAIGFRSGCAAQSLSRLHFLGSKAIAKPSTRGLHSTGMEAASTTVPSIVVYVTVPNKDAGIQSVYWWDGKIQTDSEELLIIKTRESLLGALTEHVKSNHEYEVPEVIALPITGGNLKYLEWIKDSTRS